MDKPREPSADPLTKLSAAGEHCRPAGALRAAPANHARRQRPRHNLAAWAQDAAIEEIEAGSAEDERLCQEQAEALLGLIVAVHGRWAQVGSDEERRAA
jgi:hypothetical protein